MSSLVRACNIVTENFVQKLMSRCVMRHLRNSIHCPITACRWHDLIIGAKTAGGGAVEDGRAIAHRDICAQVNCVLKCNQIGNCHDESMILKRIFGIAVCCRYDWSMSEMRGMLDIYPSRSKTPRPISVKWIKDLLLFIKSLSAKFHPPSSTDMTWKVIYKFWTEKRKK